MEQQHLLAPMTIQDSLGKALHFPSHCHIEEKDTKISKLAKGKGTTCGKTSKARKYTDEHKNESK